MYSLIILAIVGFFLLGLVNLMKNKTKIPISLEEVDEAPYHFNSIKEELNNEEVVRLLKQTPATPQTSFSRLSDAAAELKEESKKKKVIVKKQEKKIPVVEIKKAPVVTKRTLIKKTEKRIYNSQPKTDVVDNFVQNILINESLQETPEPKHHSHDNSAHQNTHHTIHHSSNHDSSHNTHHHNHDHGGNHDNTSHSDSLLTD